MATDPTSQPFSGKIRPYSSENLTPATSKKTRPYEVPEFEGSKTIEGIKSGVRETARMVPVLGKIYKTEPEEQSIVGKAVRTAIKLTPQFHAALTGASQVYDTFPSFFGRSYEQVKREEGKPLPKSVTESTRYKIGEFVGMDIPFTALDFASGGATAVVRHGTQAVARNSLRKLAMKSTYSHAAYRTTATAGKNIVAGAIATELRDKGLPEWASDLTAIVTGKVAIPYVIDKSGAYLLNKGTDYLLKRAGRVKEAGITPTWANSSDDALSEVALGVLQKDMATRNAMKNFVASQDTEFKNALMNIVDVDTQMADDASNFLTDVLESKADVLASEEEALSAQQKALGDQSEAIALDIKAARTRSEDTEEATRRLLEDEKAPIIDTSQQRRQIVEETTRTLPEAQVSVSDNVISNAASTIRATAQTPADQEASKLIDSIPVITTAPSRAVESIYDSISPRIGQPEAGELYKNLRQQAYEIALPEKRRLYRDLTSAAEKSGYDIPLKQFNNLILLLSDQVRSLTNLPFRSPMQERALQRLRNVISAFDSPTETFDFGDDISFPTSEVPTLAKLWEARKSFGQSINWKSNLPGEKILKEQYHKFNNILEAQMKSAGLLEKYNTANQMYISRFLPLEQGTNGKVRFMNPQEAGRVLNLEALRALSEFLPLNALNPLRRHALERIVGLPKTGEMGGAQLQKIENVKRYLTPSEQANFNSLADMEIIKAKVAANQLGEIERFIETNRGNLTSQVMKALEKVAEELRSNIDLPVEYITGRAQLAELERRTAEQYEALHAERKAQKTALKREVRTLKAKAKEIAASGAERQKQLAAQIRENTKAVKNVKAQKQRLEKSFLGIILQQDTNKALLNNMSSLDGIKEVKDLLGNSPTAQSIFKDLKMRKAQQIFENAASISSITKLMKNEHSRTLLKELLPAEMFSKLESLSTLAGEMQVKLRYFVNASNTEITRSHMQTFKEISGAVADLFTKGIATGALRFAAKFLIPSTVKVAVAKAMTNPNFLKKTEDFFAKLNRNPSSKETTKAAKDWLSLFVQVSAATTPEPQENREKQRSPRR